MLSATRPLPLTLLLALLPLAFGYWVNAHAPHPASRAPARTYCTRYCALHYCPHATQTNSPAYFQLRPLYNATVRALASGGQGWYVATNLAVYLVAVPLLLGWLTYGALRNVPTIRRLRKTSTQ